MRFGYAYKTSDGVRHEAAMEASSREMVFEALRAQGIRPIKVVAADGSKANGEEKAPHGYRLVSRVFIILTIALVPLVLLVLTLVPDILGTKIDFFSRVSRTVQTALPRHQLYGDPGKRGTARHDHRRCLLPAVQNFLYCLRR